MPTRLAREITTKPAHRGCSILKVAGTALCLAPLAHAEPVPAELARFVQTDSSQATIRLIGTLDSSDADQAAIQVIAPAYAQVRLGTQLTDGTFSPRAGTVTERSINTSPEGDVPIDAKYHPSGASYFLLHRASRNIIRFDAATNTPIQTYPLAGTLPVAMDITPDGSHLLVLYFTQDQFGAIDTTSGAETLVTTGDAPGSLRVTPDGTRLLVNCVMDNTLRVYSLPTLTEERSITVPGSTQVLSFGLESGVVDLRFPNPITFLDASRILFPGRFNSLVAVVDFVTGARTDIPTTASPAGAAVSANGAVIAVGHSATNGVVSIIDPSTLTVSRVINSPGSNTFGNGPVVLNATGTRAVVSYQNAARWLDLSTDTFGPALNTSNLEDLLVNASGTRVIGVGFSGAVIDFATGALLGRANDAVVCTRGAVSPIADRAVMTSWPTFGDDLVVIDTDTTPARLFFGPTANAPEGDIARAAAVSNDGTRAVTTGLYSDNLIIFDTLTQPPQLPTYAPMDQRPGEVELTPDGARAVGVNLDGTSVSVINLAAATTTAVPSATRLSQVEIDPAGAFAYIAQLANGDGVRKLNLTTNTFVGGLTATADMGGVGYAYSQVSQIALSPDAALLAVPGAFTDRLDLVNTSTMTIAQSFPLGTFITRVSWSPEGDEVLVSDRDADLVHVLRRATPASPFAVVGSIAVGDQPYDTIALPNSSRAFVINFGATPTAPATLGVLDTTTLTQTQTIPLANTPVGMTLSADGTVLSILTTQETTTVGGGVFTRVVDGLLTQINTATLAEVSAVDTNQTASGLASDSAGAVHAAPGMSSEVLVLVAPGCDSIDFNNDGLFPDTLDIDDFLSVFAGGPCSNDPNCGDIDFNNDGLFPDTLDIDGLLSAFSGGCA
jgi:WD40 repeat protein